MKPSGQESQGGAELQGRQWGKSTVAALWGVYRLFFVPRATVLIGGPSQKQSGETLRKVRYFSAVM